MRRHAFVIMPFGTKPIDHLGSDPLQKASFEIDFNCVYRELLCPALEKADCDVQRADNDSVAGDIRTQVLFELVTADIVLADVSTSNPNVFYELGIRHGVRQANRSNASRNKGRDGVRVGKGTGQHNRIGSRGRRF